MEIVDYIRSVERGLSLKRGVASVDEPHIKQLGRSRAGLSVRCHFFDESFLEIKENVDTSRCHPEHLKYSYQYVNSNGEQVFRYDNAHDHPEVGVSNEHKHIGPDEDNRIEDGDRPHYKKIFSEVAQYILSSAE